MKQIRCINAKTYNLTVGNTYETLNDTDNEDVYTIVNDLRLTRNYAASLFEDVRTELTDAEILDSISLNDEDEITLLGRESQELTYTVAGSLSNNTSRISCGISEITGVNNMIDNICNFVNGQFGNNEEALRRLIASKMFSLVFHDKLISNRVALCMVSTNTNHGRFDLIEEYLNGISTYNTTAQNPNSGNEIVFWLIPYPQD